LGSGIDWGMEGVTFTLTFRFCAGAEIDVGNAVAFAAVGIIVVVAVVVAVVATVGTVAIDPEMIFCGDESLSAFKRL